jgi:type VI secretion system protein ImpK
MGMNDNPFAEPNDNDRTMAIPRAVARAAAQSPPAAAPPTAAVSPPDASPPGATNAADADLRRHDVGDAVAQGQVGPEKFADLPPIGASPIVAASAPLLALLSGLRNVATIPDPSRLRQRAVTEVRRYEQSLRDARVPLEQIRTSHYALCASLDDVVQNTPWGSRGPWADASLASTFHQEVRSGERFFDLLTRLCQNAGKFLPVIELMYLCMSLGMQGRYRLSPRGPAELDRVREETYLIILRQRGAAEPALSPHWRGISAPYRPLRMELPVWLTALIAAGLLGLAYALISFGLNAESDRLFEAGLSLPPATMPTIARSAPPKPLPPAPQPPGNRKTLADLLAPEIAAGQVSVVGTPAVPVLRIQSTGMFLSGSATIEQRFLPVLSRIAAALAGRGGPLHIIGYTDNQPIHTVAFPSNFQLSLARARAAAAIFGATIAPSRITAEGRADADPIASNATPDGRQQNRRIEIVAGPVEAPQGETPKGETPKGETP